MSRRAPRGTRVFSGPAAADDVSALWRRSERLRRPADRATTGFAFGLHHNSANTGEPADEKTTGLDHLSLAVAERSDLDAWADWLGRRGVAHSGVHEVADPIPYATLVFRDPDNIQLEFIHLPS